MNEQLTTLKDELLQRLEINQGDLLELKNMLPFIPSRQEADLLFELKDRLTTGEALSDFYCYFVEVMTSYLLEDKETPGEITKQEAKWLRAKITRKGEVDDVDRRLLKNLRQKSITFPSFLHFKNRSILFFESMLFGLRFVTFLAVLGSMIASVILFITSSLKVWEGMCYALNYSSENVRYAKSLVVFFVEAIDGYLFATVLIIFSIGLYELFIDKIDPVSLKNDSRPNWLKITSIDDLKSSLGKVILMILIVSFFEHSFSLHYTDALELLYLGLSILLVSGALFLTHKSN